MCSFQEDSVRKVCSENGKIVFCARCFRCSDAKTAQVSKNAARSCHSHSAIPIPPRGLFFPIKKNVPRHILAPRRGCFSNHLSLRRVCIPAERFLSYRNEVSYTIKRMCLGTFSRRGAVAFAAICPCAACASSRSIFYRIKTKFPIR